MIWVSTEKVSVRLNLSMFKLNKKLQKKSKSDILCLSPMEKKKRAKKREELRNTERKTVREEFA